MYHRVSPERGVPQPGGRRARLHLLTRNICLGKKDRVDMHCRCAAVLTSCLGAAPALKAARSACLQRVATAAYGAAEAALPNARQESSESEAEAVVAACCGAPASSDDSQHPAARSAAGGQRTSQQGAGGVRHVAC